MRAGGLLAVLLLVAGTVRAQDYLDCHFAPGWEPSGPIRQYRADNLYELKDGGAEGYLAFGFARLRGITCKAGPDTLDVDVSEMSDADSAYGIFTANLDPNLPIAKLGMGGQVQRQSASFAKGKYYVEIVETAANPESDRSAMLTALAGRMLQHIEGRESPPEELEWFSKEDQVSVRAVPESVLGLRQLRRGYVAKYKQGQAFLVREASPESAAAVFKSLRERFDAASPAKIGDEAFQAKVKYLDAISIFRKGRYLGGYANMAETPQAVSLAGSLAARVP